jgi:hypothetical protein
MLIMVKMIMRLKMDRECELFFVNVLFVVAFVFVFTCLSVCIQQAQTLLFTTKKVKFQTCTTKQKKRS